MQKDELFKTDKIKRFEFNRAVASVFDDMLHRSIPFYPHVIDLTITLMQHYIKENMCVVDLGCSTATLLIEAARKLPKDSKLIGIDNSQPMLEMAKKKADAYGVSIDLRHGDITSMQWGMADCIIANYTLQFIKPILREKVAHHIYESLYPGGICIFSEKVCFKNEMFHETIVSIYHAYKKSQGYSDIEIAKKKEALEEVLIPYTIEENKNMMKQAGFKHIDTLFQWGNFVTFVAHK